MKIVCLHYGVIANTGKKGLNNIYWLACLRCKRALVLNYKLNVDRASILVERGDGKVPFKIKDNRVDLHCLPIAEYCRKKYGDSK